MAKRPTESRTLRFNLLALVVFALATPEAGKVIPTKYLPYVGLVVVVGNKYLRLKTSESIALPQRRRASRAKRTA